MALSRQLLEMLQCPNCGHDTLEYEEADNHLGCPNCRLVYGVVDDVPVLLVDEAKRME